MLTRKKNNLGIKKNRQPGEIYWNALINDEVQRVRNERVSNDNKVNASQVNTVKPQIHRRKSGSA